jgi:hypothetical protein
MKTFIFSLLSVCLYTSGNALDVTVSNINSTQTNHYFTGLNASLAIQKAVKAVRKDRGGVVFIKEGVYNLTAQIIMYGNITLKGDGMNLTVLRLADYAPAYKRAGLIRATFQNGDCNNISVQHMTLDGNKKNQHTSETETYGRFGLFTEVCNDTLFDFVRVTSFQGYGFDPHGKKPYSWGYNLTVSNCHADNNYWDGFTLDQTINIRCVNNTAIDNGRHGFNIVTGSRNVLIENVTSYNNGYGYPTPQTSTGCGITVQNNQEFGTHTGVIMFNNLQGDKKASLCIDEIHSYTVFNNTMTTPGIRCVYNKGSNDTLIYNNACVNSRGVFMFNDTGLPTFSVIAVNNTIIKATIG